MTPEIARHFKPAPYKRYPHVGKFTIQEPSGEKRSVTLWHDRAFGDTSNIQPRFFEENSTHWLRLGVDKINKMSRDNYDELLNGLFVPRQANDDDYYTEHELHIKKPNHFIAIERTIYELSEDQKHRRIKRITKPVREDDPAAVNTYREAITHLEQSGIIFAEDFNHWMPQPPHGAKSKLITRINFPPK